jgi:thymidylate synthase (FAD)
MQVEFIGQSVEYIGGYGGNETVESAARTCTQSKAGNAAEFVAWLLRSGHLSPVEFGFADFLIECDRGIQQELTRHRHFSFNVESTRWVNYTKKPLRFVTKPPEGMDVLPNAVKMLEELCRVSATVYEALLEMGAPRDYARKALPLATASRMRMAGNLRAWFEMLPRRRGKAAHPEVRELAREISGILHDKVSGTIFRR